MLRSILGVAAAALAGAQAQAQTYVTFVVPDAGFTVANSINGAGAIAGYYQGQFGLDGFVRAADGTITAFSDNSGTETIVAGIDRNGTVVGNYLDGNLAYHGFIRTSDGTITNFDPRHSMFTQVTAVNGSTIGSASRPGFPNHIEGFQRLRHGRTYEFGCGPGVPVVQPLAINSLGVMAGSFDYHQAHHHFHEKGHAFIRNTDGSCVLFDAPGAAQTSALGINDGGTTTGTYMNLARTGLGPAHGFVRAADGTFAEFDVPGALETDPAAINSAGTIIGTYRDSNRLEHAFLRTADGTITPFDAPGATETTAGAINDSGVIVGSYATPASEGTAFIRSP